MKVLGFARPSPSFAISFAKRKGWGTFARHTVTSLIHSFIYFRSLGQVCKHLDDKQHALIVDYHICGAATVLGPALFENQNSHLQRNLRQSISAVTHQTSGASAVRETSEPALEHAQSWHMSITSTGFGLQHTSRMSRLSPKTPASIEAQNSELQRDGGQHVSAVARQALDASTVQETLSSNNQAQLQDGGVHGLTLTALACTPLSGCRGPKQDSQLSSNMTGNSKDATACMVCMHAAEQAGPWHGSKKAMPGCVCTSSNRCILSANSMLVFVRVPMTVKH